MRAKVADGNPLAVLQDEDQQQKQDQREERGGYPHPAGAGPPDTVGWQRHAALAPILRCPHIGAGLWAARRLRCHQRLTSWDKSGSRGAPIGPDHFLKASLTFSPACLRSPFDSSARPSASRPASSVAWPVFFLILPLTSVTLLAALFSAPMIGLPSTCSQA